MMSQMMTRGELSIGGASGKSLIDKSLGSVIVAVIAVAVVAVAVVE